MCSKGGAHSGLPETKVASPSILIGTSPAGGRKIDGAGPSCLSSQAVPTRG